MKVHEYQAKEILARYGVAVPRSELATTVDEAVAAAKELGSAVVVVKAQVHAGGRGKAGGVKVAKSLDEVREKAAAIIGMKLVSKQTGPEGRLVKKVLVEEGVGIARELYLGVVLDRAVGLPVMMASKFGGMEIEEVAEEHPEAILKEHFEPAAGLRAFQARKLGFALELSGESLKRFVAFATALARAFADSDASMAEINPLIVTTSGDVMALDAKMTFDDNALYRHPDIVAMRDLDEEDPYEVEASKYDLNFIKLDGTIGCMVNGAGLAMATMDIIKHHGGAPANFLDVGGGASQERVEQAFRILTSDPKVDAVLVNIFGGIVRCDMIATAVVNAARKLDLKVPLVVRLQGTNVEEGRRILSESGLAIEPAELMAEAAAKVVAASRRGR
jgi:succinyl-CoA synthetase beta subunit